MSSAAATGSACAVLNAWSGEDVRIPEVEAALDELRRTEQLPATRTSVLSLVIVADDGAEADRAVEGVHGLGGRHPARTIVLRTAAGDDPAAPSRIDADVALLGGEADGHGVWFEDVQLTVRGRVTRHLDSLIEPFTLPDLPVVAWFVDRLPAPDEPLFEPADLVLVDARDFHDADSFTALNRLQRGLPLLDLSWVRLQPWRSLLASLFDGPDTAPFVHHVIRAEVTGKPGPRLLLAGWLTDRLDLPVHGVTLTPAEHVEIHLHANRSGTAARFSITRPGDDRVLHAEADIDGGPTIRTQVALPERSPSWGLAEALSRLHADPVYEGALRAALRL